MGSKILHIFGKLDRGGAELRTIEVVRQLPNDHYSFDFLALSGESGTLDDELRTRGSNIYYMRIGSANFLYRYFQLLRTLHFSVVHSHVHYVSGLLLAVAKAAGVPRRIAHFRSTSDGRPVTTFRQLRNQTLRSMIDRSATNILAVSRGVMDEAWGRDWQTDSRCMVAYNGIDAAKLRQGVSKLELRRRFGVSEDSLLCIHIGRMSPAKNHRRLIKIFHAMHSLAPSAKLLLVGKTENSTIVKECMDLIEALGLQKSVTFLGERGDVSEVLNAANIMVFPSLWEGLPGAVLEAAAVGLPVLASALPGTNEIAQHCPSVQTLSLEQSDEVWASHALQLAEWFRDHEQAKRAQEAFDSSVFALERVIPFYAELWSADKK